MSQSSGTSLHDHRAPLMRAVSQTDDASGAELSFAEELMWQAEPGNPGAVPFFDCARSLWLILHIQGFVNQDALQNSLDAIVRRHEVLSSRFIVRDGEPVRLTCQFPSFSFTAMDRRSLSSENPCAIMENEIRPQLEGQFDLAHGPLLRAALVSLSGREHLLAIAVHHIVFDLWSGRLLESELRRLYEAHIAGTQPQLQKLPVQYQDYVLWQRKQPDSQRGRELSKYWIDKLSELPDLRLPCDGASREAISVQSCSSWFTIPAEEVSRLVVLSRKARTTLAATMLAIFTVFLYRLSGMDDIAVGVPLSDRRRPEFEHVIGLFMNVVVVRTSISSRMTFLELLDRVRHGLVDACLHQDLPYGYLRRIIPARTLYRVVFNFMPGLQELESELAGLQTRHLSMPTKLQSLADLSLLLRHEEGSLLGRLVYKADLISEDCGRSFAAQIQALTTSILQSPRNCIDTCQTA